MKLCTLVLVGLVGSVTSATAETDGWEVSYEVLGAPADSATLHFKKAFSAMGLEEEWYAVYDATTGKRRTSQPTYRACGVSDDPKATCEGGGAPITKPSGKRTVEKLRKQHGAPLADSLLVAKTKVDEATYLKTLTSSGHTQVFAGKDVEVKLTTKLEGSKQLPDPLQSGKSASFSLLVEITGTNGWSTTSKIYAEPTVTVENANVSVWTGVYVTGVAIAKDHRAIGLVFDGKPFVITRPKAKKP